MKIRFFGLLAIAAIGVGIVNADSTAAGGRAQSTPEYTQACVSKDTGVVRYVTGTDTCKRNEHAVALPSEGIPGPEGPMGPQGPAGADGADGATGPMGPQGPAGADGATGPMGPQGPAGADGATGPMGPQGPAGADGATGPMGPQGPAGADGTDGVDGATGPAGPAGPQGTPGVSGLQVVSVTGGALVNGTGSASAMCPTGKRAIGGGGSILNGGTVVMLTESRPVLSAGNSLGWFAAGIESTTYDTNWTVTAYAVCAFVS